MAVMKEFLLSPQVKSTLISLAASICLYAVVIRLSRGRMSREEFWKVKASLLVCFLAAVLVTIFLVSRGLFVGVNYD